MVTMPLKFMEWAMFAKKKLAERFKKRGMLTDFKQVVDKIADFCHINVARCCKKEDKIGGKLQHFEIWLGNMVNGSTLG